MQDKLPENSGLHFSGKHLCMEDVRISAIAREAGTPVYVYSRSAVENNWRQFDTALSAHKHQVCFAVKANSNIAVLSLLAKLGSGFDIVSGGELYRVLKAGGDPSKIFFSGVGKRADEIEHALQAGIGCFNVESPSELVLLGQKATSLGITANVAVRVNPNVDANTHPYITTGRYCDKFGVSFDMAAEMYEQIAQHPMLQAVGVDCHIGSQIKSARIYAIAATQVINFADHIRALGHPIEHIDLGGGFAVSYDGMPVPAPEEYIKAISECVGRREYQIVIEPGRSIVAPAGILVTQVLYIKSTPEKHFAVVDTAMNDLIRPVLYQSQHRIVPVEQSKAEAVNYEVVGPVCESGDTFASDYPLATREGALLAILSAGAYGFSMASNYNSRPQPAEVMVDNDQWHIIRLRESLDDLVDGECLLPSATKD